MHVPLFYRIAKFTRYIGSKSFSMMKGGIFFEVNTQHTNKTFQILHTITSSSLMKANQQLE